jgi:ATP-binding cassette subfamily B protein
MIGKLMRRYALTRQGAIDFIKCTAITTLQNIMLMVPVALMYYLAADLINGTVPANHRYTYITGCVIILVVFGVVFFVQYNSSFFSTYRESEHRRINIAEKLRTLPLSFFGKKDLADLTSTILGDCTVLEHNFSHVMPQFFGAMISTVLIAISLFFFDWRMALAALWVLPIALIIVGCSGNVQRGISRRKRNVAIAQADGLQEYLETIKDLKSYNAEESYLEGLNGRITALEKESFKAELGTAVFVVSASCILRFGIGTVALVGSVLLCSGKLDVLTFFMFILVVSRIYEPMQGTLMNLAAVIAQDVNVERMNEITDYPVQKGSDELDVKSYDIEFSNVSFSYDKNEKVLNDISFTAKQGEVTALIGPSGGGKSTVSKLAARFWDVDGGSIRLGGKDISQVDPEKLLAAYSIVFQDVILFDNTIMENIRIGRKGATDEEVMRAAEQAQCDEFISRLPDGYQTVIGENGSALSGGERQRISIARALLKDAPVVLLDEATASLDAENETYIQEAISRLIKNKTVIIIAHRMRTVSGADKIVVIDGGHVAETGKPSELIKKNGIYARMVRLQTSE